MISLAEKELKDIKKEKNEKKLKIFYYQKIKTMKKYYCWD